MKFLHLGDLHLGKSLGDFDLIEDQKYILNQVIGLIDKQSVDAVLIAGDVYDKSIQDDWRACSKNGAGIPLPCSRS